MPKIEEKPAFWYDGKAYKTRLEAQRAEFQGLFYQCQRKAQALLSCKHQAPAISLTDKHYWDCECSKIEELTDFLQDLLCYRKRLLSLIEQEQEKKEIAPDWGKTIGGYFSQHDIPNVPDEVA